jgi:nicotinamidase-related amidase
MDSARTAFISVDIQVGFCGRHGYVDVMGYDLSLTASALAPIKKCLDAVCGTGSSTDHRSSRHVSCRPRVRLLQ